MHDRLDHHNMNDETSLTAALRALPADAPLQDAWPQLAARTRRRRVTRRILWTGLPAAFAAGIALAIAWPHLQLHRSMPSPVRIATPLATPAQTTPATDVAALQASSRQWQSWVATLDRDGAPLNGNALANAVALQDRIGLVDLQLSAASDPATASRLWQQRITLLQQLGLLHLQPYTVARQTRAGPNTTLM